MKVAALTTLVTALAATSSSHAVDINVRGAEAPMNRPRMDIRIATKDILNNPTALFNKNTLAMDNNVAIVRTNMVFMQNDRLALREAVQKALQIPVEADVTTAVVAKRMLRAVSASDSDAGLMRQANAIVVAKMGGEDVNALMQRIADFVDAAAGAEMDYEQAMQSDAPRGMVVLIGTRDILPTKEATQQFRTAVAMTKDDMKMSTSVQHEFYGRYGIWGPGWGYGWRYPMGYWNLYGAGLYGGHCGLGFGYGGFYYC